MSRTLQSLGPSGLFTRTQFHRRSSARQCIAVPVCSSTICQPSDSNEQPTTSNRFCALLRTAENVRNVLKVARSKVAEAAPALSIKDTHALNWLSSVDTKALACAALVAPALPGQGVSELLSNRTFWAGFWGWFLAQFLKIFTQWFKHGRFDPTAFFKSGGMPSSHSALCAACATDLALTYGLGSPLFSIAVCFSVIVMYDAAGVRRHAGKQAEVLNQVINELLVGHPVSKVQLKEVLGHTPLQVACGAVLGIATGILLPQPIPVL